MEGGGGVPLDLEMQGRDPGNYGWGGRVCVNKGEALDRGMKCRAGGGYGRGGGVPPPYLEEN